MFLLAPFHFTLFPGPLLSLFPSMRSTSIEIKLGVGKVMEELVDKDSALPEGSTIIGGQYRLVELLHQRPRVNLYLGRRLSQRHGIIPQDEPLVAIRELVLTDLSPQLSKQIEQAAFEEFVSPTAPGIPRLPGAIERTGSEGNRHYLVMQLRRVGTEQRSFFMTLAELLRSQHQWPLWLNMETALSWGIQLCRMVARLHRSGLVLGDLDPAIVVGVREGTAEWAPVLLVCWPPAPQFWPKTSMHLLAAEQYARIFPIAKNSIINTFAAPETLRGIGDERSDVYSLGAILYLLLTGYAPTSALLRQRCSAMSNFSHTEPGGSALLESIELIPPHLLNGRLPTVLENIVLCALALDPAERYESVFSLAEALEGMNLFPSFPQI